MIGTVTAESSVSRPIHVAGTVSYLSWGLDAAFGHPLTLTLKKNSSNSSLAVSIGASTTGWVTDSSHSAGVSIGDVLDFATNIGVASVSSYSGGFNCVSARFDATTDSAQLLTASGPSQISPTIMQRFVNFVGILGSGDREETLQQFRSLVAGTWQNMACNLEDNAFDETTTIQSRKNCSPGFMAVSIPACTSGYFEDNITFDRDAVSSGDLLDYGLVASASGNGQNFTNELDWSAFPRHKCASVHDRRLGGGGSAFKRHDIFFALRRGLSSPHHPSRHRVVSVFVSRIAVYQLCYRDHGCRDIHLARKR